MIATLISFLIPAAVVVAMAYGCAFVARQIPGVPAKAPDWIWIVTGIILALLLLQRLGL